MESIIYMDHAATTAVRPEVVDAMIPFFTQQYGNPSSIYSFSSGIKEELEKSRRIAANAINCIASEIYFTSGGTEADNWAVKGIARVMKNKGRHIITSRIEHHAILHACQALEAEGYDITYLNVDEHGIIKLDELRAAIREDTILISVMFANNEVGTIQPIKEIGRIAAQNKIIFHTDAVQAFMQLPIDVKELGIDMLSTSAHKLNGPKGTGFLYVKKGIGLEPYIDGGAQERGMRAGTENVAGIVGFGKAIELAQRDIQERMEYEEMLRDYIINRILRELPFVRLNGHKKNRLPNNINISIQFIEGESLLIMLDMNGICASSGSACTSGSIEPSHVLCAMGLPNELARGSLRLTIGAENTREEADYVIDTLKDIVEKLRSMSPLYEDYNRSMTKNN